MGRTKRHLESLTNRALVTAYNRLSPRYDKLNNKLIEVGMGALSPSDMRKIPNPPKVVMDFLTLCDMRMEMRAEAERRYGPGLIVVDQLIWKGSN